MADLKSKFEKAVKDSKGLPEVILIASGSEVSLAVGAAELEQLVKRFKLNRRKWVREPGSEAASRADQRGYGKNAIYLPQPKTPGNGKEGMAA